MNYENILTQTEDGICFITINRESKLNALNIQTLQEIKQAVKNTQDDDQIKVIILTGIGSKAFAAGADIAEFANFSVEKGTEMSAAGQVVMNTINTSAKPVIAAVNGFALGGGCELAMACHIRIASTNAKFGQPEVNLGLIPGYAGTQRLIQLIGKGKALELLMTGDAINAEEAKSLGLVNHIVSPEELMNKCKEMAKKIMTKAPLAISSIIRLANDFYEPNKNGYQNETNDFGMFFGTQDFKEGVDAFLNKRKASFVGK